MTMNEKEALVLVDELDADQGYLFGRVMAEPECMNDMIASVRAKLEVIRAALSPSPVTPDASGLLPCPFCGGANIGNYDEPVSLSSVEYWVSCNDCGALSGNFITKERALNHWNTRASSSLAELEAENHRIEELCVRKGERVHQLESEVEALQAKLDKRTKALEESIQKLETYGFECEAGPLSLCKDWIELKGAVNGTNK